MIGKVGDGGVRRERPCGCATECALTHRLECMLEQREGRSSSGSRRRNRGRAASPFARAVAGLVVGLLLLLLGVANLGGVAEAAMTFVPTNVAQLSLYQTAQMRFNSNPFAGDPHISEGDKIYFINVDSSVSCNARGSGDPHNAFNVTPLNGLGLIGYSTIVVRSSVFSAGVSYRICYITQGKAHLISPATSSALLVWPSLYDHYEMRPSSASGGLGPVVLTLNEKPQEGRPLNQGLTGPNTIFLLPCSVGGGADCSEMDQLPQLCASGTGKGIQLSDLRGAGTALVTGSFTVPYVPDSDGYAVCVPYCSDATVGCGTSVEMSYTAVTVPAIKFANANPFTYQLTPAAPQAREKGYMLLQGTGLTAEDTVTVIRDGDTCASKTPSLLNNLELGTLAAAGKNAVNITFVAPELIQGAMRGTVCYRRAGEELWSTVLRDPQVQVADFVIEILQPTGFKVAPEVPYTGRPLSLFFTGEGLNAAQDAVILTTSTACDSVASPETMFPCPLTGGTAPQCTAIIDPLSNLGLTLYVCYRKGGVPSYARVNGSITTQNRDPIFSIRPYPLYAGQKGTLTFLGAGALPH
ncbi:hypothetical protein TraAM80_06590 [Trypanosoma rangeli]|uniref:Hemagluttinin family protein n=1 Tax=Trypanosoma rangeli TaxID=5698 RepID=A0A422N9E7_TRYRA|nr:uncharacterized protein TraAM80_06590 [Trypanosoma rangeli]RNF02104.1 hypothetical protein TraAM80_06590 [Trypanosoma rangeli]|eukprot:RNF02104.1 hypothetical protein TraAM80_06590 [Trypanosoma rangeli]